MRDRVRIALGFTPYVRKKGLRGDGLGGQNRSQHQNDVGQRQCNPVARCAQHSNTSIPTQSPPADVLATVMLCEQPSIAALSTASQIRRCLTTELRKEIFEFC